MHAVSPVRSPPFSTSITVQSSHLVDAPVSLPRGSSSIGNNINNQSVEQPRRRRVEPFESGSRRLGWESTPAPNGFSHNREKRGVVCFLDVIRTGKKETQFEASHSTG
jgi:hypothetical protein